MNCGMVLIFFISKLEMPKSRSEKILQIARQMNHAADCSTLMFATTRAGNRTPTGIMIEFRAALLITFLSITVKLEGDPMCPELLSTLAYTDFVIHA